MPKAKTPNQTIDKITKLKFLTSKSNPKYKPINIKINVARILIKKLNKNFEKTISKGLICLYSKSFLLAEKEPARSLHSCSKKEKCHYIYC